MDAALREDFIGILRSLAAPAEEQVAHIAGERARVGLDAITPVMEVLWVPFDDAWCRAMDAVRAKQLAPGQLAPIWDLARLLDAMTDEPLHLFWTTEAIASHSAWQQVRCLAGIALEKFTSPDRTGL